MTRVKIHLARIHKPVRHFVDGLVEDNGRCLKTHTIIPTHISAPWSEAWQQEGRIPFGKVIGSVSKYKSEGDSEGRIAKTANLANP
jgi:hypothetical protein